MGLSSNSKGATAVATTALGNDITLFRIARTEQIQSDRVIAYEIRDAIKSGLFPLHNRATFAPVTKACIGAAFGCCGGAIVEGQEVYRIYV